MGTEIVGRVVRGGLSGLMLFGEVSEEVGDHVGVWEEEHFRQRK